MGLLELLLIPLCKCFPVVNDLRPPAKNKLIQKILLKWLPGVDWSEKVEECSANLCVVTASKSKVLEGGTVEADHDDGRQVHLVHAGELQAGQP